MSTPNETPPTPSESDGMIDVGPFPTEFPSSYVQYPTRAKATPTETRPPEGYATWLDYMLDHEGEMWSWQFDYARAELSALRARCEQLRGELDEWKQTAETLRESAACRANGEDALRAENAKYREAMREIEGYSNCGCMPLCRCWTPGTLEEFKDSAITIARRALGNAQEGT